MSLSLSEIAPTGDHLVVRPLLVGSLASRGFIVPETVTEWIPPTQGEVLTAGPRAQTVPGTRILFGLGIGVEVPLSDGSKVRIIRQADVISEMT